MVDPKRIASSPPHERRDRIRKSLEMRQDTGLVASLYERVPKQREINIEFNQYSEADNDALKEYLAGKIRSDLKALHESSGGGHSNPPWLMATLEGNAEHTFGNYEDAQRHHEAALQHSSTRTQTAISHANLSDTLRRRGHYAESVTHALEAVELDPRNEGFWAYLVMALYKAGDTEDARQLLRDVAARSDLEQANSVWRNYILTYNEFQEMRDEGMPEAIQLFQLIQGGE